MKKVLFLSLGTGSVLKLDDVKTERSIKDPQKQKEYHSEKMNEAIESGIFSYQKTKYCINDNAKNLIETEFVGEVLAREEDPDYIYILGTVKSCWTSFYTKFADKNKRKMEDILALDKIEYDGNVNTGMDEIKEEEEKINKIYENGEVHKGLIPDSSKDVVVKAVLLRYGIDKDQLIENYSILSNVWNKLNKSEQYHVSFDITHSFRSMPIYNLTLLDYMKQIKDYNIYLDHVYYGNYEVKGTDEKGYAPIVDLADLVSVSDLSKGVSEFKNVGSSLSLFKDIPDDQSELKIELERFYWAVQMNDLMEISKSINAIMDLPKNPSISTNRYTDLQDMIKNALSDILGGKPKDFSDISDPYEVWKLGYMIAKWHRDKNRYSEAVLAALEALKCYLAPMYLEDVDPLHRNPDIKKCTDYETGQKALDQLIKLESKNPEVLELADLAKTLREIRNKFAHYHVEHEVTQDVLNNRDQVKERGKVDKRDKVKECLDNFLKKLENIHQEEFKKAYQINDIEKYQAKKRLENKEKDKEQETEKDLKAGAGMTTACAGRVTSTSQRKKAILLTFPNKCQDLNNLLKNKYDLWCINENISNIIRKESNWWAHDAVVLYEYLNDQMTNDSQVDGETKIIIYLLSPEMSLFYALILANQGIKNISYLKWKDKKLTEVPVQEYKDKNKEFYMFIAAKPIVNSVQCRTIATEYEYKYPLKPIGEILDRKLD